jgi:hypothetical protein
MDQHLRDGSKELEYDKRQKDTDGVSIFVVWGFNAFGELEGKNGSSKAEDKCQSPRKHVACFLIAHGNIFRVQTSTISQTCSRKLTKRISQAVHSHQLDELHEPYFTKVL